MRVAAKPDGSLKTIILPVASLRHGIGVELGGWQKITSNAEARGA